MYDEQLKHLPDAKRRELERVVRILFDEFEDKQKTALSDKRKVGRILKIILFGSYARGDWVEDLSSGYRSDYDLLVVVSAHTFTDLHRYWDNADEHLVREYAVTKHLSAPVNFIVHSLEDVNDQLSKGRPFFVDIARDGVALYNDPGHVLAKPKLLSDQERLAEAGAYYQQWMPGALSRFELAQEALKRGFLKDAAFDLHQTVERHYHCFLLVFTLYSPKSHRLSILKSQAEGLDPYLQQVWPTDTKIGRQSFAKLQKAYVEARYSAGYSISTDELDWLFARVGVLQRVVDGACKERLQPPS
jgi:predicted nucleotidyltransferase/HEPN domain-containing protein